MGTLYIVSTPIGNLEDVTARAARILGEVASVLSEDTRRTGILLKHLGVRTSLLSLHGHNEASRVDTVLARLKSGEDLALVSDAGTPLVSDPGARLVEAVVEAGHDVVPIPGPSAVMAALVGSGLAGGGFTFLGFVPRKGKERAAFLERMADTDHPTVSFESPERLEVLLRDLAATCGEDRRVAVGREITKLHETFFRGTLAAAASFYAESPPRGEVTVVLEGGDPSGNPDVADTEAARVLAGALMDQGQKSSQAAREVARRLGLPRNLAYEIVQSLSDPNKGPDS
ncbi:MAG: 16S rRNA (cytidine(1402)-2'-O)-methyltransferase [Gemmatimonadota bacterium]|nr:MAG: 16S rRNA (cytidine(1402)-2'-O)-methyltransferase [Gemmatimonadota bacterium]